METIHTILQLVTQNRWMSSVDLKDAYYSVKVSSKFQKYLKFFHEGKLYKFTAWPNGLSPCPRKFTKILKPPFANLRLLGHIISGYLDDSFLQGKTYDACVKNTIDTIIMLDKLGFVIHPDKSAFLPKQIIVFLGFTINSVDMTLTLTDEKILKIETLILQVLNSEKVTIREVARVIGYFISSLPAVRYGALYYRALEKDKVEALKISKGNFEAKMQISPKARYELNWWLANLNTSFNTIDHPPIDFTLTSDASFKGWGASMGDDSTGGQWAPEELEDIHILELRAALFALKCFKKSIISGKHVKIMIDNTTAVAAINNQGTSHCDKTNDLAFDVWQFCMKHDLHLTAAYIPGVLNKVSDYESRNFKSQDKEWMLNPKLLTKAFETLKFTPEIDLFASRLNKQLPQYCAYRPDPDAKFIDAFSISWSHIKFYCFPPFSCILRAVRKII